MTEQLPPDVSEFDEFEAAYQVGSKVIEMADRLKPADMVVPGAQAKWVFELDDHKFELVMSVHRA